ncbi:hypothetical protein B0O80DRAFT_456696 [Mortierella sp. GBAus27b]|nr:hypothetical protein B0O80DRAFT_456696 [Mortierella sp. GBAus27b]
MLLLQLFLPFLLFLLLLSQSLLLIPLPSGFCVFQPQSFFVLFQELDHRLLLGKQTLALVIVNVFHKVAVVRLQSVHKSPGYLVHAMRPSQVLD